MLKIRPPEWGDLYYGDSFEQLIGNNVERVLFGITDIHGDKVYDIVPGPLTYSFEVVHGSTKTDVFYVLACEALVTDSNLQFHRKIRCQARLIRKTDFHQMILNKQITKESI